MSSTVTWPPTHDAKPPAGHLYGAAVWLLGRHPQLAGLAERVPGVVTVDDEGPDIDLDALAEAFLARDRLVDQWEAYEHRTPAPRDDADYERWQAAGPKTTPAARAVGVMSGGEVARLRLLAAFSTCQVPLSVADLRPLDDAGQALLADWCQVVQVQ
jgi:hypothetical protein